MGILVIAVVKRLAVCPYCREFNSWQVFRFVLLFPVGNVAALFPKPVKYSVWAGL